MYGCWVFFRFFFRGSDSMFWTLEVKRLFQTMDSTGDGAINLEERLGKMVQQQLSDMCSNSCKC